MVLDKIKMSRLGFLNLISNKPDATWASYKSIRELYPVAPFVFSVDGMGNWPLYDPVGDLYDENLEWDDPVGDLYDENLEWVFNSQNLGYPPYTKEKALEWLQRVYICVLKLNTDHFMMVEDDVILFHHPQYKEEDQCIGHAITHGNVIPEVLMYEIQRYSGNIAQTNYYGAGGGSIFKSSTFLANYDRITTYLNKKWYLYEKHYHPQCGFMDFYMTLFYMLCGKHYTPNHRMKNLDPHNPTENGMSFITDHQSLKMLYGGDYDILHNTKFYYPR